ncbi:MAG TPA: S-layer homology domain-containing protein [Chloroflexia bacterium]|nr:S-layer homology domain-containing protein [Chloroflexia bacterium]
MNAHLFARLTHRASTSHYRFVILVITTALVLVGLLSQSYGAGASPVSGSEPQNATLNNWTNLYPDLQRVSAVSGSEAWAAGSYGELLHYTGGAWTSVDVPTMQGVYPYDINMRSAADGWIAAGYRAFQYDGTNWVEKSSGLGYNIASVYGISPLAPNNAWGVAWTPAGYGFIHWDGTQWTTAGPILPSSSYMNALSMSSSTDGWAIGQVYVSSYWQGTMYHYDGVSWQQVANPAGIAPLRGIWTSPTMPGEAWATGGDSSHPGTVYHYSNGSWSARTTPSNTVPGSIFMLNPNEGWATIVQSVTGILHWNGTSWSLEYTSNFYLRSIAGGPGMTWAVGNGGTIVSRPDAGNWTRQRGAPTFNNLNAVHALNANDAWAVGTYNTALHYDGNSWQQVPALLDSSFYDVQMLSANDVYAVGSNAIAHWDGTSWTRVALPPNTLRGIAMTSPGEGWAVGDSGSFWQGTGGSWSAVSTGITRTLTSIAMDSPTHGWAVGGDLSQQYSSIPALIEYTGGAWVDRSSTLPANVGNLEDIVLAPGGNEGWAVGQVRATNERSFIHLLNGVWTLDPYQTQAGIFAVDMFSQDDVWAVGSNAFHRTNGAWSQMLLPNTSPVTGLSLVPGFGGWAVGAYGSILRLDLPAGGGTPTSTSLPITATATSTVFVNCSAQVSNAVASCSLPNTYNYDFTVSSTCGITATGDVVFVVGPNASGPWTTLSTLPFQQVFSPGNNTIQGNVSAAVPAQYSWYRFELDGRLGTGLGFGAPTASHPVCGPSTATPTSIPTSTPTASPSATASCVGDSPDCSTATPVVTSTTGTPISSSATPVPPTDTPVPQTSTATATSTPECEVLAWREVPNPSTGTLRGVESIAPDDVWAVGDAGAILHWDGTTWSQVPSPISDDLYAVSASSTDDVWVASPDGILHWDGVEWSVSYSNPGDDFYGIEAISSDDVWAVGSGPGTYFWSSLTMHWDGSEWTRVPSYLHARPNGFRSVSALSPTDVWAVGNRTDVTTYPLIQHWEGAQWANVSPPLGAPCYTGGLSDLYTISPTDIWAVGSCSFGVGLALHYDGSTWTQTAMPDIGDLYTVSALASDDIWAGGEEGILHWDGSAWSISYDAGAAIHAIDALSPNDMWAVGSTILHYSEALFADVSPSNTFYRYIQCIGCRGIISGYEDGTFRPNADVTRGQIAKIVSNSAGFNEDAGEQIYEDVPGSNPFYVWVNRLSRRGYMSGYPCGTVPEEPCNAPDNRPYFRPGNSATRGQLAKIVSNAAGYKDTPPDQLFTDIAPDHPFYIWVQRLASRGFISGYACGGPGEPCDDLDRPYFRAYNNVTRGQTSKIVANTFFPECATR